MHKSVKISFIQSAKRKYMKCFRIQSADTQWLGRCQFIPLGWHREATSGVPDLASKWEDSRNTMQKTNPLSPSSSAGFPYTARVSSTSGGGTAKHSSKDCTFPRFAFQVLAAYSPDFAWTTIATLPLVMHSRGAQPTVAARAHSWIFRTTL